MVWIVLSLGLLSFLISLPLCAAAGRLSVRWGLVDAAGSEAHKRAVERPVPNTGGVGVFAGLAVPLAAVLAGVWLHPSWWAWLPGADALRPYLGGLRAAAGIGGVVLGGLTVMHVLGLIDDRRALGAGLKLLVQAAVAAALVWLGDTRVLVFLGGEGPGWGLWVSWAVSLVWLVVVTNAMNFLDNMDGLAAGVGLIAAALYLAATLIGGQWFVAGLAALLCGSLMGFLIFNLPPARLYLGDGGSLVLGLALGVISVRTTYVDFDAGRGGAWYGVLMPVLVLAVPLYDFTSVTLIRLLRGQSPFRGDHNHFSHRLLRKGLGKPAALAVVLLATLATGLGGVMLGRLAGWQAGLVAGQAAAVLTLLAVLELAGRRS